MSHKRQKKFYDVNDIISSLHILLLLLLMKIPIHNNFQVNLEGSLHLPKWVSTWEINDVAKKYFKFPGTLVNKCSKMGKICVPLLQCPTLFYINSNSPLSYEEHTLLKQANCGNSKRYGSVSVCCTVDDNSQWQTKIYAIINRRPGIHWIKNIHI